MNSWLCHFYNELVNYYYKSDTTNYSIIGDKTFRELNSLAIGQYPITIRGFDRHGIPSSNQVSFILDIKKPFYLILQQYLFICLFIIVFFIIYIIYDRNQKNKLMRNHQLLEFELSSLQSQLNPHFISNSMLAINNFIKENNSTIAENYIMDFSRLMRLVLESSKLKTISLKDEIDLLKYYSKLEQLRFNNSFDIQIDIDEAIDLELLQIPSMMIQPYIENAINHGLINKKQGRGLLQISIQEHQDESIRFVIQDNGVGYNNKKIQNNKKSRSSQLISDRVSLLKSLSDIDISINILDLSEQDPKLTGTLVEIIFPEIY